MATVDITATPVIFVTNSNNYGINRLVIRRSLLAMCQYTIADNCYKAFLHLSNSKLFQGTL
jgi:hypothetical protein